jgi:hypothetical protein
VIGAGPGALSLAVETIVSPRFAAIVSTLRAVGAVGYKPGGRLSWTEPASQPVIQASRGLGLIAHSIGAEADARALRHRTLVVSLFPALAGSCRLQ